MNQTLKSLLALSILVCSPLVAQENLAPYTPPEKRLDPSQNVIEPPDSPFFLDVRDPSERSTFWVPFLSMVLPGFGQYYEGDYGYGAAYTGTAVAGYTYAAMTALEYEEATGKDLDELRDPFDANPPLYEKKIRLGEQVAMSAGSFSAYHSFRSSVQSYKDGRYGFLGPGETPGELLLAPFRFDYLKRPSTIWPIALAGALHYLAMQQDWEAEDYQVVPLGQDGVFYTGAYSFNAGTHEEALFRGWLLPEMYVATGRHEFWTKASNALLFAVAHLGNIGTPIPQLLFGYYLSDLTMENNWRIGEAIFIHTWWDVFAFLTVHKLKDRSAKNYKMSLAPIALPLLNMRF